MKKTPVLVILLLSLSPYCLRADMVKGLNLSVPLMVSGSLGIPLGGGDPAQQTIPMIEIEAGVGGGRLLLGLDGTRKGVGFGVKAALMRTWFEPIDIDEDQLYLGAEFQASVQRLVGSVGTYYNIDGNDDDFIVTLGLGIRL